MVRKVTRREFTRIAGLATGGWGASLVRPQSAPPARAPQGPPAPAGTPPADASLYSTLLKDWCDALVSLQVVNVANPALHGGILCPACGVIHGRCGDAIYPLMRMARSTGDSKYIQAAMLVYDWSEARVSQPDGSWFNDVDLNPWKGITVFRAIALAEALVHHGPLLEEYPRRRWKERLARAAYFLDGFMSIDTGVINYPSTSAYCFAICGQVLEDSHYLERARQMAHAALEYFTPNGLLFGEGHPQKAVSPKGCRPVDLGYNVEESLPSLGLYALVTHDKEVLDRVVSSLRTHMEFMLPDGAWDNSWGTRNHKWSWWGSRTSDGCQTAYELLADHDPRFREVARRNLELLAKCTGGGLLYGGPDYRVHGDLPCVHHTFTHAKPLATVLDRATGALPPAPGLRLPREQAQGLKSYPEIATWLAAIGDWRATVTGYDCGYQEHPLLPGGGHASGGAMSILYHRALGPLLVASMNQYQLIELLNQQMPRDAPHMTSTPRIESSADGRTYTSLSDFGAAVTASATPQQITLTAEGRLLTVALQHPERDVHYKLVYRLTAGKVEIVASVDTAGPAPLLLVLPVVSPRDEAVERVDAGTVRVAKPKGRLLVHTDAPKGFEKQAVARTFNLVPGFECVPLAVTMLPGKETRVELSLASG